MYRLTLIVMSIILVFGFVVLANEDAQEKWANPNEYVKSSVNPEILEQIVLEPIDECSPSISSYLDSCSS